MTARMLNLPDVRAFEQQNPLVETRFECDATRTVPAGGALAGLLLHDSMIPFQFLFRVLPDPGIHTATRSQPCIMTLGAFTVPHQQSLLLTEYRFRLYRFDGLIPGDAVPLEDRRLSLEIGNTVPINGFVQRSNLRAQIIPGPLPPATQTMFQPNPNPGTPGDASRPAGQVAAFPGTIPDPYAVSSPITSSLAAAPVTFPIVNPNQFVMSGAGSSLIPNSNDPTQGSERMPYTMYVPEDATVSLQTTAFAPVRIPLAFIEGVLSGFLMEARTMQALLEKVRPCQGM